MCGIAALISAQPSAQSANITAMCDAVRHRGPDGEGYVFLDGRGANLPQRSTRAMARAYAATSRVALGHRRLAIVDLSDAADQPMCFGPDGRFWITYNGEIYNFPELRRELEAAGFQFRSRSDTEVILAAYMAWGTECLRRFNGMFAFVLYDRAADRIFVARDRYGVKPLYFWRAPHGTVAFASEIKQFTVLPNWVSHLNGARAYDYLTWGLADHSDETMFRGVHQLPPGHFLEIRVSATAREFTTQRWYAVRGSAAKVDFVDAADAFRELLVDAVRLRLRADVDIGAALSGGLDSSSIVCITDHLRTTQSGGPIHTFSARAHESGFDEGRFINVVTGSTRSVPHMAYPDADSLLADFDELVWHHDEPFNSTSIYAEWQVFRLARRERVKVVLDGHGADEILAGYPSFVGPLLTSLLRRRQLLTFAREARAQRHVHQRSWRFLVGAIADSVMPPFVRYGLRKLTGHTVPNPDWLALERLGATPHDPFHAITRRWGHDTQALSISQLSATSLPMQLKWADRSSMAHSVESRSPFLDYRVVDFAISMPTPYMLKDGETKRLLRAAMMSIVPADILGRQDKMGFVTPEENWARRDEPKRFRAVLESAVAAAGGVLTPRATEMGYAIIDGRLPFHARLWRMICFGRWMQRFAVTTTA